jgi:hypothetical protein
MPDYWLVIVPVESGREYRQSIPMFFSSNFTALLRFLNKAPVLGYYRGQ